MPIDVLNEEVKDLTNDQIDSVIVFVRNLKKKPESKGKTGLPLEPGHFSYKLKFLADDFDTCIPEGFEEYM